MKTTTAAMPKMVSKEEWEKAIEKFRAKEKAYMEAGDELNAERRKLPMVRMKDYTFQGLEGKRSLVDLFNGRRQLIVYHFMFDPSWDEGCVGCSMFTDNLPNHLSHLYARDTAFTLMSRAPLEKLTAYRERMGWKYPWYSSFQNEFNKDVGATVDGEETHGLSAFLRDDDKVYRTYHTIARGVEPLGTIWGLLDVTPYGRQEAWENSPEGWPQTEPYTWWRRHDEYEGE